MPGKFITLEGGEGTGKSTQARRLSARLRQAGIEVVETREPGGSPFAERVRELILDHRTPEHGPLAEALLFAAARADHLDACIRPAVARGAWVVCDRFADSTRVYQGTAGGLPAEVIATLEQLVVGVTQPDLTLLLDLDAAQGLARAAHRQADSAQAIADNFEQRHLDFHLRLRDGFLALAKAEPSRIAVVDASQSMDRVEVAIWDAVRLRLAATGS